MKRRDFVILSPLGLTSLSNIGCSTKSQEETIVDLIAIQDQYLEYFYSGEIEKMMEFYAPEFSYASDSVQGSDKAERVLRAAYRLQKSKGIIPYRNKNRTVSKLIDDQVGLLLLEIKSNSERTIHGILTQIFLKRKAKWKIIHNHFSAPNS